MLARTPYLRVLALLLLGLMAVGAATTATAAEDKIGPKVGRPLKAAKEAMDKSQWDKAMAKIDEADAVKEKTPFEQYQINEFKGYVLLKEKKYAEVAKVYEANLALNVMPANELPERLKTLVQLNTFVKNYPKVIEYGDRWIKAGGEDLDTRMLVAQANYLQKDYRQAVAIAQGVIRSAEQSGKKVDENWLQLVRSAQTNMGDTDGAAKTMEKLVRLYPKPEYWDYLLSSRMRQKNSDRVMLNLYRLADQVGVLDNPDEYAEMSVMLLEAGLPGEARTVMEEGYQKKIFDTTDKSRADRYKRRLDDAKAAAAKDQQSLPTIEKDAAKAKTGQGDVALGMAYSSFGEYDKAVAALSRGLDKGDVRDPDQAEIMLGIANLKLGKKADAVKAFQKVDDDPQMADIARLWTIVAQSNAS